VVEDNPDNAWGLASLVELWGYEPQVASDGESALGVFVEFEPQVVVADIGLPRIDGYELARRLRLMTAGSPERCVFVALTGYGQPGDRRRALAAGFDHHLTKPVEPGSLEEILATCADRPVPAGSG
jgi:CheY-like chemotaxis protein